MVHSTVLFISLISASLAIPLPSNPGGFGFNPSGGGGFNPPPRPMYSSDSSYMNYNNPYGRSTYSSTNRRTGLSQGLFSQNAPGSTYQHFSTNQNHYVHESFPRDPEAQIDRPAFPPGFTTNTHGTGTRASRIRSDERENLANKEENSNIGEGSSTTVEPHDKHDGTTGN